LEQRALGQTGHNVSLVGFGALSIGRDWGIGSAAHRERPTEADAVAVLRGVLDLGVTLVDTASAYHRSEDRIGLALADRRQQYFLSTKCGEHSLEPDTFYDFSYEAVRESIRRSLDRLRTDVIDLLQIHFGPEPEAVLDDGGCLRAMREAQDAGLVRLLGASVNGPVLDRCIDSGAFQVVQVGYSLLHPEEHDRLSKAHDRGIGVLVRSSLAGGWLSRRVLAVEPAERPSTVDRLLEMCGGDPNLLTSLALHFVAAHPGVGSILIGSRTTTNVRQAVEALERPVDDELLREARALIAQETDHAAG
jgi:aryl-alcohol dehydrogenase-like predicted oxidoreductase